ncbi:MULTISPECIES: 1-deoxy-D-xylulose-5-phosphate reductoisomerase [Thermoactinomyces]|uniref:1-deoxy-D-xylulose 5-phosphate reductoisomerase n=1 Tax=Thermoactinomyces vulgaris TaxID=2026 RepID=A0ABS0QHH6_THEVU|nr:MULTISPECIES: 1-deoxy-D-xylulose-5-phosphate reductoisomerase [Thermoactinomyces]KFZ39713.1 1-deoxy-D-xylulose 5-phosphate reductoisomerase [Thermoactinomyces sp. Gus2-1]KYQ87079.1 1-deoxy-D-xylulose 5-phosphate reductoisomerase [Thermoactinomyces sp. AS95]MBA4551535.1 1-deoxy-D-xylulose-5-phosphate reductoisomerase [Thermoactinomyces vulgaris]MBA4597522.1 1-deoxy-D-xylulose-5-phosphate reductoisomerase [Thermoactinomyces vulgaris]MBH8582657.1 1-deoxy-D-xylulose-5-phosphate reductoisomerase
MLEKVAILGSTGSIGTSTLAVIREHPEQFEVVALAAGNNANLMIQQVKEFQPRLVSMATREAAEAVKREVGDEVRVMWGDEGLKEVAASPDSTYLVSALVGSKGLVPTLEAIRAGKKIGLANKETLVTAGHIVTAEAKKHQVPLLPIDSEHSALFQCLHGERMDDVERVIITASGGAFRDWSREELVDATVEQALNHPNWAMGNKITIDSATMMNKGFEVIEAHWLFDFPYEKIDVVLHPQSVIHSMVEFKDGAVMAQLGTPDMRVPIQYALSYPKRMQLTTKRLDFVQLSRLDFKEMDFKRYPCLKMAYDAGKTGGTVPAVLNAANEVAVQTFLQGKCTFLAIEEIIERTLDAHQAVSNPSLEEIEEADRWARQFAQDGLVPLA